MAPTDRVQAFTFTPDQAQRVWATMEDDVIIGDIRLNTFNGRGGDDELHNGIGRNRMEGGRGVDTFVLTLDTSRDRINNCTSEDQIDFSNYGRGLDFSDPRFEARPDGNIVVTLQGDRLIVDAEDRLRIDMMVRDDFIFA